MGNSKIPAYGGGCCGSVNVPVARVVQAPVKVIDYTSVINKPSIEGVELVGDRTMEDFGYDFEHNVVTEEQIDELFE